MKGLVCEAPDLPLNLFLAGGITGCDDWQSEIIELAKTSDDFNNVIIYNPRRASFDVSNINESNKQIKWEFFMLERMDVFSMYFDGSSSLQPICLYELGRNIERMRSRFPDDFAERIVITCDKGYSRCMDVVHQVSLATNGCVSVNIVDEDSVKVHYNNIATVINKIRQKYLLTIN